MAFRSAICGIGLLAMLAAPGAGMAAGQRDISYRPPAGELNSKTEIRLAFPKGFRRGQYHRGDRIRLVVDRDVLDRDGNVLIREGAPAYGIVTMSRGSNMWGRKARLQIALQSTEAVDGQSVPLRGMFTRSGSHVPIDEGETFTAQVDRNMAVALR